MILDWPIAGEDDHNYYYPEMIYIGFSVDTASPNPSANSLINKQNYPQT